MQEPVTYLQFISDVATNIFWIGLACFVIWFSFRMENPKQSRGSIRTEVHEANAIQPTPIKDFLSNVLMKFVGLTIFFGIPYSFWKDLSTRSEPSLAAVSDPIIFVLTFVYVMSIPLLFWHWRGETKDINQRESWVDNQKSKMLDKGLKGEKITHDALTSRAAKAILGKDHYLFEDKGCLILQPEKADSTSQEIDHLLITAFGVFVIETKYWGGKIDIVGNNQILCHDHTGEQLKTNPLFQTRNKVNRIERHLGEAVPVKALAVFSSPDTILGNGDWTDMVLVEDLLSYFEKAKNDYLALGAPAVNVEQVRAALSPIVYAQSDAKHKHLLSTNNQEYLDLLDKSAQIKASKPKMKWLFTSRRVNLVMAAEIALILLAGILAVAFPQPHLAVKKSAELQSGKNGAAQSTSTSPTKPKTAIEPAPPWIPPPPPPYRQGWATPKEAAQSQANAQIVSGLVDKARQCYLKAQYQCAYMRAYEAYQIDPINDIASGIMRNAIHEQNNLIALANTKRQQQGSTSMQAPQNLPGYISQPNPAR